ncbi:putative DNA-binding protein with PD1-like motif [Methanolinea mesophila]|uniref:PPC domain-containing DNA-binding protein n=1 Tax=Methanolinea mesophila TaxID=547055 RepID=UPI001AE91870|nr:PPC domain-containing DNA-binding protein [Methanolinea mesophila]MBP1928778.1 putative DNA-binding protein with PD1-like motif [Methanolinea mesophila]
MRYAEGRPGRIFYLRIDHGEDLVAGLLSFVKAHNIRSAVIQLLGALLEGSMVTGPEHPVLPPDPHWDTFSGGWEILGIATVSWTGEGPHLHLHSTVGRGTNVLTGCIRGKTEVYIVVEAVIQEIRGCTVERVFDQATGLDLPNPRGEHHPPL